LGEIPFNQGQQTTQNKVLLLQVLLDFHPISYIQGKNSIKEGIVIYHSLKLDLGNNLAWPNSLKEGIVSYNSLK
jgi:hypothetical protein